MRRLEKENHMDGLQSTSPVLEGWCHEIVDAGVFATSIQIAVLRDGRIVAETFGSNLDRDLGSDDLCELHCLTKPVIAWKLLELASDHGIDLTAPASSLVPALDHLDESVSIAGICAQQTRLAQPSGLGWLTTAIEQRPSVGQLRQEVEGEFYSEVGAWMVAKALIEHFEATTAEESVAEMLGRLGADIHLDSTRVADRLGSVVVPIMGLPDDYIPMLHVRHPTYLGRLGVPFGGLGSMAGYVTFLAEVDACWHRRPTRFRIDDEVMAQIAQAQRPVGRDGTWKRDVGFVAGFVSGATPHEMLDRDDFLLMFAGIGSATALLDLRDGSAFAAYIDSASFDAEDLRFIRRQMIAAFLER